MQQQLVRHGRTVTTFFDMLGMHENDMTDALAFTLSRSSSFLQALVGDLGFSKSFSPDDVVLSVQTRRPAEGITDLEVQIGTSFFAVFEAKRGSALPTESQLRLYAPVLARRAAPTSFLVALTNATPAFEAATLERVTIPGVALSHRSWRQLRSLAALARIHDTHDAKRLLDQFIVYLEVILGMETRYDNRVFVVSLGGGNPDGWSLSWIDIVEKRNRYFYPVGHRWPDPPNYLGFRYRGKLQRIHHVEGYDRSRTFMKCSPRRLTSQLSVRITVSGSGTRSSRLTRSQLVPASRETTACGASSILSSPHLQ